MFCILCRFKFFTRQASYFFCIYYSTRSIPMSQWLLLAHTSEDDSVLSLSSSAAAASKTHDSKSFRLFARRFSHSFIAAHLFFAHSIFLHINFTHLSLPCSVIVVFAFFIFSSNLSFSSSVCVCSFGSFGSTSISIYHSAFGVFLCVFFFVVHIGRQFVVHSRKHSLSPAQSIYLSLLLLLFRQ